MTKGTADACCEAADGDWTGWLGRQDSNLCIRKLCAARLTERADRARACWEYGAPYVATFALHDRVGPIGHNFRPRGSSPPAPASQSGLHRLTYEVAQNCAVPRHFADMGFVSVCGIWQWKRHSCLLLRGPFFVSRFFMSASPGSSDPRECTRRTPTAVVSALRDQAPAEVPKRDAQALSLRWHLAGCLARCVAGACFRTERDRKRSGGHGQGGCTLR